MYIVLRLYDPFGTGNGILIGAHYDIFIFYPHDLVDIRSDNIESVFNEQHGISAIGKRAKCAEQDMRAINIEVRERLVENYDFLLHRERRSGNQSLLLPAGHSPRLCVGRYFHHICARLYPTVYCLDRDIEVFAPESYFVADDIIDYLFIGVLEHSAYELRALADSGGGNILGIYIDFPLKLSRHYKRNHAVDY